MKNKWQLGKVRDCNETGLGGHLAVSLAGTHLDYVSPCWQIAFMPITRSYGAIGRPCVPLLMTTTFAITSELAWALLSS